MSEERESYLQPGVTKTKAAIVYTGAILILISSTLGAQGIAQIQTAILTKYNGMQYFATLSVLATMGLAIMMPVGGKFSDLFGRKILLLIGGVIFTAGSIIASLAPSLNIFLIFRAVIPFGQAITMVVSYAVLAGIFKGKGRNIAYSVLSGVLGIGMFLGGTFAGFLSDINQSWLAIFYPGILLLIGVVMISSQITNVKREGKIYIDFPGILLLAITIIGMMCATTFGSIVGWSSPIILVAIAAFVLGLIGFVFVERKSPEPVIPIYMFKNPLVVGILLISLLTVIYQKPMQVYIPLMLQKVMGITQAISGTVLGARSLTNIIFPTIIAAWAVKKLNARIWKVLFLCGMTIAVAFFMISNSGSSTSLIIYFISFALMGIAESCKAAVITPFMQSVVDPKDIGAATALNSFFGSVGAAIAASFIGLYYNAVVPDPQNVPVLQKGLNQLFVVTGLTGVVIMILAFFFVRAASNKGESKKSKIY